MHPKHQMHSHIESVDTRKLPSVDCFQFSLPCQPFSASGDLLGGEDARAALWTYALKCIKLHRPRLFSMENVWTLVQRFPLEFQKMLKYFRRVCKSAYLVQHMDWNAKEHGSPSNRPRVVILGFGFRFSGLCGCLEVGFGVEFRALPLADEVETLCSVLAGVILPVC